MLMSEEDWDSVMDVSSKGMYNVTKNVINQMLRKRSGRIINIVSLSGLKGVAGQTNLFGSKRSYDWCNKGVSFWKLPNVKLR